MRTLERKHQTLVQWVYWVKDIIVNLNFLVVHNTVAMFAKVNIDVALTHFHTISKTTDLYPYCMHDLRPKCMYTKSSHKFPALESFNYSYCFIHKVLWQGALKMMFRMSKWLHNGALQDFYRWGCHIGPKCIMWTICSSLNQSWTQSHES